MSACNIQKVVDSMVTLLASELGGSDNLRLKLENGVLSLLEDLSEQFMFVTQYVHHNRH